MIVLNPCSAGFSSTWMGDRPGTNFCPWRLMFTSASSQIKFIRKKSDLLVHYTFQLMRYPALHLFLSALIRLLHRLFFFSLPPPPPPPVCSLHFTLSLQSAFYHQSAIYTWSAVCSLWFYTDRF